MWKFLFRETDKNRRAQLLGEAGIEGANVKILKKGFAMRVIFFYPGEEGTYVDNAHVTLYENGIVHIRSNQEETTTVLQNCEILWNFEVDSEERSNKVRLLKPKSGAATEARIGGSPEDGETKPPTV
jgi:hypothetical protein